MELRKEQNGQNVTLWDDTHGVGLQFTEGESLQRYTSAIVYTDEAIADTEEKVALLARLTEEITEEAAKLYPKEFAPIAEPEE